MVGLGNYKAVKGIAGHEYWTGLVFTGKIEVAIRRRK